MSKVNDKCLEAFANKQAFMGSNCSVTFSQIDSNIVNLYSYDLLIGTNENGQISLLPYPAPKTPMLNGGSKTSRKLINAAWLKFPNAENKQLDSITSFDNQTCFLSNEVYVIDEEYFINHFIHASDKNKKFRKISGVERSKVPGYHFVKEYVTLCPIDAEVACFLGFPKEFVKLVK